MIARMWHGWAGSAADADAYEAHYRTEVLDHLQGVDGFAGARLLRHQTGAGDDDGGGGEVELISITFFDDIEAVRRFAGPGYETAVVAEEARRVLRRFDPTVTHLEVAFTI